MGELTAKQKGFVAAFTSLARGNATEAAKLAGYAATKRSTLAEIGRENLRKPGIASAVEAAFAEFRREGATLKEVRLAAKNERWWALMRVLAHRAARYRAQIGDHDAEAAAAEAARRVFGRVVPFEATEGLLVEKETVSGNVRSVEWSVDVAMLKELRELEKDIAAEVGEAPGVNVTHSGTVTHTIRRPDYSALSDDELEQLSELAAKVAAGEVPV